MRTFEFDRVVRGVEVTVKCEDFSGDESVGIAYGPEVVYAIDANGDDFELTDDEVEQFGIFASQCAYESDDWLEIE